MRLNSGVHRGRWWKRDNFCLWEYNLAGYKNMVQSRNRVMLTCNGAFWSLDAASSSRSFTECQSGPGTIKPFKIHHYMRQISLAFIELISVIWANKFPVWIKISSFLFSLDPESPGFYFLTYEMNKKYLVCWAVGKVMHIKSLACSRCWISDIKVDIGQYFWLSNILIPFLFGGSLAPYEPELILEADKPALLPVAKLHKLDAFQTDLESETRYGTKYQPCGPLSGESGPSRGSCMWS